VIPDIEPCPQPHLKRALLVRVGREIGIREGYCCEINSCAHASLCHRRRCRVAAGDLLKVSVLLYVREVARVIGSCDPRDNKKSLS
jgi:hypothetical protein